NAVRPGARRSTCGSLQEPGFRYTADRTGMCHPTADLNRKPQRNPDRGPGLAYGTRGV
ncbi:uncharacterized protein METZ01_LOCUS288164, partial [marine metagenome]